MTIGSTKKNPLTNDRRALIALHALIGCMSHKIRTPLSVISNELNVVKLSGDTTDCDRAIERCKEIAAILKNLSAAISLSEEEEDFPVQELLPAWSGELESSSKIIIRGHRGQLTLAFNYLRQLLLLIPGASDETVTCSSVKMDTQGNILMQLSAPAHPLFFDSKTEEKATSLTEFFTHKLDIDSTAAPLADAMLWAHGCDIVITSGKELEVALNFKAS